MKEAESSILARLVAALRRYFISGLLVWIPIAVTIFVIRFVLNLLDSSVLLLPHRYQPEHLYGYHVPGLGIMLTIAVLFILIYGC